MSEQAGAVSGEPARIRAVGFDLGETLVEYRGIPLNWQREYPAALRAVVATWSDAPLPNGVVAGSAVLERYNTRLVPREHEIGHRALFEELLAAMGAPPGGIDSLIEPAADAFFGYFRRQVCPVPGAAEVVDGLIGAGVPVGVLTDVPYGMPRRLALADLDDCGLGVLVSAALTSADVGYRKPHVRGFLVLADLLGCRPGEVLYVGNERKDMAGAVRAGMHAALLWRGDDPPPDWGQDEVIAGLDAVPDLVAVR